MIRKKLASILLLLVLVILCFEIAYGQEQQVLEYKPFNRAIYHVSATGVDTSPVSPQVFETDSYDPANRNFDVRVLHVSHREMDVNDLLLLRKVSFSHFGIKVMFEVENNKEGAIGAATLTRSPFLFPMFSEKDRISKIGDEWEIKTFPVAYEFGAYGPISRGDNPVIKFKWLDTVDVGGFQCAMVDFSIVDHWKDSKTGKILKLNCNGTVYFAINEGVIVSEWFRVTHDVRMGKIEKTINSTIKFRLLHYEPYTEDEGRVRGRP